MPVTEELTVKPDLIMGRYRLGRRLGAGGFGAVHEALDERLDRKVAVKVIPADDAAPERARREARAAARLDHPGIVSVFDAGEEPGARFLVSELVEGRTLATLEAQGALSDRDVLRIGLALCDALGHAHERGVVHRDVKPQNVIVPDTPRSWRGAAKLTDFGVARLAGDEALTLTGDVVGTIAYMAPEQAAGRPADERADLYALALVLYEALAGTNPVRGATPAATARRVGSVLPPLARSRRDLPAELCAAVDRALLPAPDDRGTLDDLADALADALPEVADEGGTIAEHPLERARLPAPPRGSARAAAALAAGALAGGALAGLTSDAAVSPLAAAAIVAALVATKLRAGWTIGAATVLVLLIVGGDSAAGGRLGATDGSSVPGTAIVLLVALAPVPILLSRLPAALSLPAAAPILGLAGLAGAFPAIAGRVAGGWLTRAALGALGAWWLLLAEPLLARTLMLGPAAGVPMRHDFEGGASLAADVIAGTVSSGLPLLLAVWALASTILPWVVRGRSLVLDVALAAAWAAGLAGGAGALAGALGLGDPRGLVAGALVGAVVAVAGARLPERRYFAHDRE